jgi:hypothetical protein
MPTTQKETANQPRLYTKFIHVPLYQKVLLYTFGHYSSCIIYKVVFPLGIIVKCRAPEIWSEISKAIELFWL